MTRKVPDKKIQPCFICEGNKIGNTSQEIRSVLIRFNHQNKCWQRFHKLQTLWKYIFNFVLWWGCACALVRFMHRGSLVGARKTCFAFKDLFSVNTSIAWNVLRSRLKHLGLSSYWRSKHSCNLYQGLLKASSGSAFTNVEAQSWAVFIPSTSWYGSHVINM